MTNSKLDAKNQIVKKKGTRLVDVLTCCWKQGKSDSAKKDIVPSTLQDETMPIESNDGDQAPGTIRFDDEETIPDEVPRVVTVTTPEKVDEEIEALSTVAVADDVSSKQIPQVTPDQKRSKSTFEKLVGSQQKSPPTPVKSNKPSKKQSELKVEATKVTPRQRNHVIQKPVMAVPKGRVTPKASPIKVGRNRTLDSFQASLESMDSLAESYWDPEDESSFITPVVTNSVEQAVFFDQHIRFLKVQTQPREVEVVWTTDVPVVQAEDVTMEDVTGESSPKEIE